MQITFLGYRLPYISFNLHQPYYSSPYSRYHFVAKNRGNYEISELVCANAPSETSPTKASMGNTTSNAIYELPET